MNIRRLVLFPIINGNYISNSGCHEGGIYFRNIGVTLVSRKNITSDQLSKQAFVIANWDMAALEGCRLLGDIWTYCSGGRRKWSGNHRSILSVGAARNGSQTGLNNALQKEMTPSCLDLIACVRACFIPGREVCLELCQVKVNVKVVQVEPRKRHMRALWMVMNLWWGRHRSARATSCGPLSRPRRHSNGGVCRQMRANWSPSRTVPLGDPENPKSLHTVVHAGYNKVISTQSSVSRTPPAAEIWSISPRSALGRDGRGIGRLYAGAPMALQPSDWARCCDLTSNLHLQAARHGPLELWATASRLVLPPREGLHWLGLDRGEMVAWPLAFGVCVARVLKSMLSSSTPSPPVPALRFLCVEAGQAIRSEVRSSKFEIRNSTVQQHFNVK
ncbi:hypothetical protein B0T17DRAFT_509728 [Bombardia bombarda]|uniref:Uncharacterized protein n=1 Tax=Bombardia bombarda TaxID=252184 RepID=A0AA39WMK2_9PEZI|nr:hypothetical protein B0T17DRAFT_509728 [Bombardia bombarda]